jgi:hypothetical protein
VQAAHGDSAGSIDYKCGELFREREDARRLAVAANAPTLESVRVELPVVAGLDR